ncbi:hypothetical protein Hanom_Chr09g00799801 [Helianthus anomalus]
MACLLCIRCVFVGVHVDVHICVLYVLICFFFAGYTRAQCYDVFYTQFYEVNVCFLSYTCVCMSNVFF